MCGVYNEAEMQVRRSYRAFLVIGLTAILAVPSLAQNQSGSPTPVKSIVGTVERISDGVIYVKSGTQLVRISSDSRTEVWKGAIVRNLSPVVVSDDIIARCRIESSGKLVAEAIWLNIANFFGVITSVADGGFDVFTNPNADPLSAYKKETRKVFFDRNTIFESSAKEDLKVGREVQLVGLDLHNGKILATRVTVYQGMRPVRVGNARIVLPNGQIR
jgi:Domain of unknown function (DUF5666)